MTGIDIIKDLIKANKIVHPEKIDFYEHLERHLLQAIEYEKKMEIIRAMEEGEYLEGLS
jgi:hypothetical protein